MKKRLLTVMIAGVLATSMTWADQSNHVGSQVLGANEIIDMLQPKVKTRGIRINQPAQAAANTQQQVAQPAAQDAVQQQQQPAQQVQQQVEVQQVAAVEQPAVAPSISMEINFAYNSAQLTNQSIAQLAPLGQALQSQELAGLAFMLEGHTDASGPDSYNMQLSEQRALSVGNFLYQSYGVDPSRLNILGRGETALLDPSNPTSGVNRRVSITTLTN